MWFWRYPVYGHEGLALEQPMKSWSILCFLIAACRVADAAPALKQKNPNYHPTKVGDNRANETRSGDQVLDTARISHFSTKTSRLALGGS